MRRPQGFFAFKQFTIHQERCGMKVSTDACIQGAWTPVTREKVCRILDVGAGTGLLSLMIAQRAPLAKIDGLEMEQDAANQAIQNIEASPFADRIVVHQCDARSYQTSYNYDLIICNPPFFSNDLESDAPARNTARHDAGFTAKDLQSLAGRALHEDGCLCVMWPERRMDEWRSLMGKAGFALLRELVVRNRPGAQPSSIISLWSRKSHRAPVSETLYIRDSSGGYTLAFIALLKDFYLRLS